jgi:hypothetical protein
MSLKVKLRRKGISVTFPLLLAEAVFCGNCLTHVGGVTPYHVVYRRQPSIMPPLAIDTENLDEEGAPNDRVEARIREVASQTMVEATAQARINRALRTQTALPGQASFELGDRVEYHRPSATKDTSGWRGPGVITEFLFDQGQVALNHQGTDIRCRVQDARQFIGLGMVLPDLQLGSTREAFQVFKQYIEPKVPGKGPRTLDVVNSKSDGLREAVNFMIAIFYHSFLTNAAISTWYIQTISDTGGEGVTVASSGKIDIFQFYIAYSDNKLILIFNQ